jgi:ABC-2 type transport system ATP-binding protein
MAAIGTLEATGRQAAVTATASVSTVAIRTQGLGRRFGDTWAVQDLDLEVRPGEVLGLLGPNGAGKTTTVRMLTALIAPSAGRAWIDGFEVSESPQEVRRRIGILTETPSLYERLTAAQNLDFFGELHGLSRERRAEMSEGLLRLFDLWDRRDTVAGQFSKGMKQKLAIARALLHEPSVLFLDEPTSGLDPASAHVVRDAIVSLKSAGRTIVLATHNLDEAERLADRVAFVRGRVLRVDSPSQLRAAEADPTVILDLARSASPETLATILALPGVRSTSATDGRLTVSVAEVDRDVPGLVRAAAISGAEILAVRTEAPSLESIYFDVMGLAPERNGASR